MLSRFSHIRLFATLQTVTHQAPLPMGFFRQEYWNGLLCCPPGDLPDPGMEPLSLMSPALAGRLFTTSATWETPSSAYCKLKKTLRIHRWASTIIALWEFHLDEGEALKQDNTFPYKIINGWDIPWKHSGWTDWSIQERYHSKKKERYHSRQHLWASFQKMGRSF